MKVNSSGMALPCQSRGSSWRPMTQSMAVPWQRYGGALLAGGLTAVTGWGGQCRPMPSHAVATRVAARGGC